MRSIQNAEKAEIAAAHTDLQDARRSLELAHAAVVAAEAPPFSELAYAEDDQWIRVARDHRRERGARWRSFLGLHPRPLAEPPGVHEATLTFLDESGAHDDAEDLHPNRLDPAQKSLDHAIKREHEANSEP